MSEINENNGLPLYYQLKELIREKINDGVWKVGERIPNELELAENYNLSRATVRQAILSLVREGLLTRKQGRGTFVAEAKLEGDFINFYYPDHLGNKHILLSVEEKECPQSVKNHLNLKSGDKVYELLRIRLFGDEPAALEKSFVVSRVVPDFLSQNFEERLYDLLNKVYNIQIVKAENYIDPIILDEYEAGLLNVKPVTPALKLTRIGKMHNDEVVVLTTSVIRGDKCRMVLKSK